MSGNGWTPSVYQKAIFDWRDHGTGHATIEAVAGSGKTTTLVRALENMKGRVLFCSFNKHIADELRTRVPANADARTIHSLGFLALARNFGSAVDRKKMPRLVSKATNSVAFETIELRHNIEKLCSIVKLTLTDPRDQMALRDLIDFYELDIKKERISSVVEAVPKVLTLDLQDTKTVDFDDMVWLPLQLRLAIRTYDWVCVDEAQDLNAAQRELVLRALGNRSRLVAIGDSRQAIYGFSGADTTSMERIGRRLNAKKLPLSICYRCPRSHVRLARSIVPQIEPRDDAPEGVLEVIKGKAMLEQVSDGDLIVCRINAPLAKIALALIRKGHKAILRGKDISSNLLTLVTRMDTDDLGICLEKLDDYRTREMDRLYRQEKEAQAHNLDDKVETVFVLSESVRTVPELKALIKEIFSDEQKGVVCSTIHRAKGLEADRVFVYRPELTPLPYAKKDWQVQQERNLQYVSFTRAKEELYLVEKEGDF